MLILEALRAKHGDALLLHCGTKAKPQLVVVDGGPPGVYTDALKPRLDEIRAERKLDATSPLEIELMMVSHIDADHIAGLLQLVAKVKDLRDARKPAPWKIRRFWHNSFDDLLGNDDASIASTASVMSTASLGGSLRPEGSLLLASVGQGRELRQLLDGLGLGGNQPFGGLVMAGRKRIKVGNLELTIVAPSKANLRALQKDWDEKVKPMLNKKSARRAEIAAYLDKSIYNLSSIVMLVESQGKRLLLTGDGRGDHTLKGLEEVGLLKDGKIEVDVLKLPHHGSDRNVDADYFEAIRAKHYVISADGKFDNPEVEALRLISGARRDNAFTVHLTYPTDEFHVPSVGKAVAKFFAKERRAGRKYKVVTREAGELSLRLALA